jgi:hypothetical protein
VILWRGTHKVASTRTGTTGKYSFALSKALRRHYVRAAATAKTVSGATCEAGSSTFIYIHA